MSSAVGTTDPPVPAGPVAAEDAELGLDPRPSPWSFFWGLVVSIMAGAFVGLIEINSQSARVITDSGRAWAIASLVGFVPPTSWGADDPRLQGWGEIIDSSLLPPTCGTDPCLTSILQAHVLVDNVFMISYTVLLIGLAVAMFRSPRIRRGAIGVSLALLATDAVENFLLLRLVETAGPAPEQAHSLANAVVATSTVKWVLVFALASSLLVRFVVPFQVVSPTDPRPRARRSLKALMHHRFSVALVLPLLVLTVLAGSPVLEQLPDVQRRWLDHQPGEGGQDLAAVGCAILLGLALLWMGRLRTDWARDHEDGADPLRSPEGAVSGRDSTERAEETAPLAVWLIPPLVAVVGALVSQVAYGPGRGVLVLILAVTGICTLLLLLVLLPVKAASQALARRPLTTAAVVVCLLLVGIGALALIQPDPPVYARRLLVFTLVPAAVVIGSLLLRRSSPPALGPTSDDPPTFDRYEIRTIWFVGLALAIGVSVIAGLGMIRAFTSVIVVGGLPSSLIDADAVASATSWIWLAVAAVTVPWLIFGGWRLYQTLYPATAEPSTLTPLGPVARKLPLAAVYLLFITIGLLPHAVGTLGVPAATILSLIAIVGLPAATGLLIQDRPTAEIFRALGLRRTPLLSVFALTIILVSLLSGRDSIHRVFPDPEAPVAERPAISDLTERWLAPTDPDQAQHPCQRTVEIGASSPDTTRTVQPMIMVAAEGGGIRATYWTVNALDTLHSETQGCSAHSVLFSAGASGGAVGLTVARFSGDPTSPDTKVALQTVKKMAGPQPLSEGVIGTFVRDPAYGATGVPLGHDGVRDWVDRARLIEVGWNASGGWGTRPFLTASNELSPVTGPLILNSSSVANRCRAWVSQVALEEAAVSGVDPACNAAQGPGPATIDLFAAYGPHPSTLPAPTRDVTDGPVTVPKTSKPLPEDCLTSIDASTAAMLAARFPYVTPGGVTGPCAVPAQEGPGWPRTQLIDGGYLENTGLATISDLAVSWLADVRAHNERALGPGVASKTPIIVPFVVFLSNDQGKAASLTEPARLESELILPAVGKLSAGQALNKTAALLQRAESTVDIDAFCPSTAAGTTTEAKDRRAVCQAIATTFPYRVIVVDRIARPEVATPLGWVLSDASMSAMDDAMSAQLTPCAPADGSGEPIQPSPSCLRGYGTMGDLVEALRPTRE